MTALEPLRFTSLAKLPMPVLRPTYDVGKLGIGIVHLGLGAFHRAHQAFYTEDAIGTGGGDWGIFAVSLRRPDSPHLLRQQDGLFTVETLADEPTYRIIGCIRGVATAPLEPTVVLQAFAAASTHIVTLTVTEKGYTLGSDGALDFDHPDIANDVRREAMPISTIGWLVSGLDARRKVDGRGLTILSCDNLTNNGTKLRNAVLAFAGTVDPTLAGWIDHEVRFPNTMVDCIVPATNDAVRSRVGTATGYADAACVQRESFAQWVIEDDFAGPRPAWETAGVEFVTDVVPYQLLKLHALNLPHSALAYFGLLRGLKFCREAVNDGQIAAFVDALMAEEVAPALPGLNIGAYWHSSRNRIGNPRINHATKQVGEDGSIKLGQRALPLIIANARAGRPTARLVAIVHAWIACCSRSMTQDPHAQRLQTWARARGTFAELLADVTILPDEFRSDAQVRAAITQPHELLGQLLRGAAT